MPDLEEALTELETHQTQLDMDGVMVGVSRQALDMAITAARAGLEAGKAEESMREALAPFADFVPDFIDDGYEDGDPVSVHGVNGNIDLTLKAGDFRRAATAIRALPLTGDDK